MFSLQQSPRPELQAQALSTFEPLATWREFLSPLCHFLI